MEVAGSDGDDVGEKANAARSFDLNGYIAVGGRSLAQLTELVISASPDGAVGFQEERVRAGVADGDGDEAEAAFGLDRGVLLRDGAADAQLSERVVASRQNNVERLHEETVVR